MRKILVVRVLVVDPIPPALLRSSTPYEVVLL
jgi:hypothetical protein